MSIMPYVIQQTSHGERSFDLYSRLLEDRIIMLNEEITDASAGIITAELLYLASVDKEKDIHLYINSPGGSISAGLAIYDTMNFIQPDVSTICMGKSASMGAFLLSSGAKGKRYILPNAEVMIHQPLGGTGENKQATDIEIVTKHILQTKQRLNTILANNCNKSIEEITKDTERDNWFTAQEAIDYGLVDEIVTSF